MLVGGGTLSRTLNRHSYSDTLNRPTSIGLVASTIQLVGNTQSPTDSAEDPFAVSSAKRLPLQFAVNAMPDPPVTEVSSRLGFESWV